MRFENAYLLWDRAGTLWSAIAPLFEKLRNDAAAPNQTIFVADDRYVISVSLDRMGITDQQPRGSLDKINENIAAVAESVIKVLRISSLERVGFRQVMILRSETMEAAREKANLAIPALATIPKLFRVEPQSYAPTFKIECDDGEIGYTAQLYTQEKKFAFNPPPDVLAIGIDVQEKVLFDFIFRRGHVHEKADCY